MKKIRIAVFLFLLWSMMGCKKRSYIPPSQPSCRGCITARSPIANAGPDQVITLPTDSVIVNGSSSYDPDGTVVSWQWTRLDGPVSCAILQNSQAITTIKSLVSGVYNFVLTVTDNNGYQGADTMKVTVLAGGSGSGHPPVADAGADINVYAPANSAGLDGSRSSDPDNDIISYTWRMLSGPGGSVLSTPNNVLCPVTGLNNDTYSFELRVTDATHLFDLDTVIVTRRGPLPGCYASNCGGYWICMEGTGLNHLIYAGPPGQAFPGAFGAACSGGGKMFFGGGHEEGSYAGLWDQLMSFDPASGLWVMRTLSLPRSHLAAICTGTKAIFAGGNNQTSAFNNSPPGLGLFNRVDLYDINTLQQTTAQLSDARSDLAVASTGTKAYFMGGRNESGYSFIMDIYDETTNSWQVKNLPRPRGNAGAVIDAGKIYLAGGKNDQGPLNIIDVFDISANSWSTILLPHEHPIANVALVNRKMIVAGGDGQSNDWVDIYDLDTGGWSSSHLSDSRYNMAMAVANNKLILLGGNFSCSVDIYNETTGSWTRSKLSDGVNGVCGASAQGKAGFMGFLFGNGNIIANTLILIDP